MTPQAALLAGLTVGGLTCLAVQGGLLLGLMARRSEDHSETEGGWTRLVAPVGAFLIAKITAYTLLGFGLGLLGSRLQLPLGARLWLQAAAGVFMILSGLRLFFPHWLPWLDIHPPASIRRIVRNSTRLRIWFAPALLGFLTVLIPCGTTQAMEVSAITTASPAAGAAILFAFTLGTVPLFIVVGILARGTALLRQRVTTGAAIVVIALGIYSVNGVLVAIDSPYAFQNEVASLRGLLNGSSESTPATGRVTIAVAASGYSPSQLTVPAGAPVTIALERHGTLGCTSLFVIPKLGVSQDIREGNRTITATFPQPGSYRFTCGMGMYSGVINAV